MKWIPVGERLPDNKEMVIVTMNVIQSDFVTTFCHALKLDPKQGWINIACYVSDGSKKDGWYFDDIYYEPLSQDVEVVAWMPFPEPYKEG